MKLRQLKERLRRFGVRPSKRLGQNFLLDLNLLAWIVRTAQATRDDVVLEIGAGTGLLTRHLAEAARRVVAVEISPQLLAICGEHLDGLDNVELINADAISSGEISQPVIDALAGVPSLKVVANLPYAISTPAICSLLSGPLPIERLVLMLQKEVARRIVAEPGGKDYGMLSVVVQVHGAARIVRKVSRRVFWPEPLVDSAIVEIIPDDARLERISEYAAFRRLAQAIFSHRRKTLLGSLISADMLDLDRNAAAEAIKNAGFDPRLRGEKLGVDSMIELANALAASIRPQ